MRALRRLSRECVSSAGPRVGARQSTYTPGDGGGEGNRVFARGGMRPGRGSVCRPVRELLAPSISFVSLKRDMESCRCAREGIK
jgi:hypothetical protein